MKTNKRELLKLVAAGLVVPVIVTLAPCRARADGSWSEQVSGSSGQDDGTDVSPSSAEGRTRVIPGSFQWRQARDRVQERRRLERGAFNQFGSREE